MMRQSFRLLDDERIERILLGTFNLLEQTGVRLSHPQARQLLQQSGARLDEKRAYLPRALVSQALESAPGEISIYNRNGEPAMHLGKHHAYYGAHTDAPEVLDPLTHQRRPCLQADVAAHARLAHHLPNIHFLTASGLVADQPALLGDRAALVQCLENSTKPVLVMPISRQSLAEMRQMAAAVVGGDQVLRVRPNLIVYAEPVSPLNHPDESIAKLLYCAEHNLPVAYSPYAACGGTAPMNPAAIVVQLCAESLSALVIHQLQQAGAPFIFGGMASVMDMKSMVFSYGAPEFQRGNSMLAEMAHALGLPNFGTGGTSDAHTLDGQALLEAASSLLMAHLCGADLVHDVGLLGSATVIMPEMVVVSDHLAQMYTHLLGEVSVEEADTSLDLFAPGVHSGEFVSDGYTLANFRRTWYPDLFLRRALPDSASATENTFEQRVKARTIELMKQPGNCELPAKTKDALRRLYQQAQASI